jgi:hypothetical protein
MIEPDVTIRIEIKEGEAPNAENVVRALAAYVEILKTAAEIVEPGSVVEIGLAGVEDGSDIFKFILRKCENFGEHLKGGMEEFPLVSKAAITLGGLIGGTMIVIGLENALSADPRIPEDQMAVFEENNQLLKESIELQRREMEFYGILQEEPAYEALEVIRPYDGQVVYRVPRGQFAARSGLWMSQDDVEVDPTSQTRTATWDVVLIKPVLVPEPRRWRFARDGIEFSALMNHREFLDAIHDKTLPVQLAEGIRMKLELKYREVYENEGWVPVAGSHRVVRVLDPLPPASIVPLFPDPGSPKK